MLAYEGTNDFCFDTEVLSKAAKTYREKAEQLNGIKSDLVSAISQLETEGWKTPAGRAFSANLEANWAVDIQRYIDLLEMLSDCVEGASKEFETVRDEAAELKIDTSAF